MAIKMEKSVMEKQGRVLIPKKIRDKVGLRSGEELHIKIVKDGLLLILSKSAKDISVELKGCVKGSKINPLALKKIWVG